MSMKSPRKRRPPGAFFVAGEYSGLFAQLAQFRTGGEVALGALLVQRFAVHLEPNAFGGVGGVVADAFDVLGHEQQVRARRDVARVFPHGGEQLAEVAGTGFVLRVHKLQGHGLAYPLMNVLGAAGVMLSLVFGIAPTNWPAILMQLAWIVIGIYGTAHAARRGVGSGEGRRLVDRSCTVAGSARHRVAIASIGRCLRWRRVLRAAGGGWVGPDVFARR
jgi:hypothetical protein